MNGIKIALAVAICSLAGVVSAAVSDLEALQAAETNLVHHFTFEGTWLDNRKSATPDLVEALENGRVSQVSGGWTIRQHLLISMPMRAAQQAMR